MQGSSPDIAKAVDDGCTDHALIGFFKERFSPSTLFHATQWSRVDAFSGFPLFFNVNLHLMAEYQG
jgi:hypothetical protein